MKKSFPINWLTEEREFFTSFVALIQPFLKGARSREADVFAELLYQNYLRQDIVNKQDRFKLILDTDNRREMEEAVGVNPQIFRNALSGLRKKSLLKEDNTIADVYLVCPNDKKIDLTFHLTLKE